MVKALQRQPAPKQPTREAEALQSGDEAKRRADKVRPVRHRIQYEKAADAAAPTIVTQAIDAGAPYPRRVTRVAIICDTTEAADPSNYAGFRVDAINPDDPTLFVRVCEEYTTNLGLTANVPREFTILTEQVKRGWPLRFRQTKHGTGIVIGRCVLTVDAEDVL